MAEGIKGFKDGLNRDIAFTKTPENVMYDAFNVRILTDDGGSSFSIQNIKGNKELSIVNASDASSSYDRAGYVIIGVEAIREDFVIFYAKDDDSGWGIIDKLIWSNNDQFTRVELYKSISTATSLEFYPNQKLETESYYEGRSTIRVYITNKYYPLRVLNVGTLGNAKLEASYSDIRNSKPTALDRIPFVNHATPEFIGYGSGSLLSGVYQYAYRLISKNGTYSSISPASNTIPTSPNIRAGSTSNLFGADTAEAQNSGMSIRMGVDLSNVDVSGYETLEVFSLYYSAANDTPTIYIIEQIPITKTNIVFIDESAEAKFGTITYAEFVTNSFDFSATTIAAKDNRLFAANIKEHQFDVTFDARAYSFDENGRCIVVNGGVEKTIVKSGSTWGVDMQYTIDGAEIPIDADAINPYNTDDTRGYKYNTEFPNGAGSNPYMLGGEGPRIQYMFADDTKKYKGYDVVGYNVATDLVELSVGINTANSDHILGLKKGFKRGEVYRFGIVFFSTKGIASPVKWIGDVMIPWGVNPEDIAVVSAGKAYPVEPIFIINTAGTDASGLDYQIVYAPVDELDRRIVAEGLLNQVVQKRVLEVGDLDNAMLSPTYSSAGWNFTLRELMETEGKTFVGNLPLEQSDADYMISKSGSTSRIAGLDYRILNDVFSLHSPEQVLLPFNYSAGLRLRIDGMYAIQNNENLEDYDPVFSPIELKSCKNLVAFEKPFDTEIFDLKSTTYDTSYTTLNRSGNPSIIISNKVDRLDTDNDFPREKNYYIGRNITFSVVDTIPNTWLDGVSQNVSLKYAKATIYRDIVPYNGDTYADRLLSLYVPASSVQKGANLVVADRGDTVISYMDYTKAYWPLDIQGSDSPSATDWRRGWMQSFWFPVESRINCFLRNDLSYLKGGGNLRADDDATIYPYLIQEKGNPTGDLYKYDDVYSKTDASRLFASLEEDDDIEAIEDVKLRYSEEKSPGEDVDSWAIFKTNNFKHAQSEFGPINRLIEFNNEILAFQDSAFSHIIINPRVTVSSDDGVATALGMGSVLERVNYISTEIGSQENSDIVKSLQAIYWLDRFKKKLYKYTGQLESLSDLKGLSGFLRNTITDNSVLRGIYDNEYTDVLLTIQSIDYETVVVESTYEEVSTEEYYEIEEMTLDTEELGKTVITVPTRVNVGSYIDLKFSGDIHRFSAVSSSPTSGEEFLAGLAEEGVLYNIYDAIQRYVNSIGNIDYTIFNGGSYIDISALRSGVLYEPDALVYNETIYTFPSSTITATTIVDGAYITLDFEGNEVTFTAKDSPSGDFEFQIEALIGDTLTALYDKIVNYLSTNFITSYDVQDNHASIEITSLVADPFYDINPRFFRNIVASTQEGDQGASNSPGLNAITPTPVNVTEDNSWVVIDFSTAGGVDKLDLYKNGSIVAQSNVLQGSNYGFPDLDAVPPYVVDRLSLTGKDYKPEDARELYLGEWDALTTYDYGDIVKVTSGSKAYYVSKITNNVGTSPVGNLTEWQPQPAEGAFDLTTHPNAAPFPEYQPYTCISAFVGTNTQIAQQIPVLGNIGVDSGLPPTRYQDYLDDGGIPSETWLGEDGTDLGSDRFVKGGVISHYNNEVNTAYPTWLRGQRIWAKYDSGDTYEIKVTGAGTATGYSLTWFILTPNTCDLNVEDSPAEGTPSDLTALNYPYTITSSLTNVPVKKTMEFTTEYTKLSPITTITKYGRNTAILATHGVKAGSYKLTNLFHTYRLSTLVDYEFNGGVFRIDSIDYTNGIAYMTLREGTASVGEVDMTEHLRYRAPFTLTYSEMLNSFVSFNTFTPTLYAKGSRLYISTNNDNTLYAHNKGNYGEFYGEQFNSWIDLVIPSFYINEFTNLAWVSEVSILSNRLPNDTIYSVKVYTQTQESDEMVLYPRSETRLVEDTEGHRLPNGGVSTVDHPYGELYNTKQNAYSQWRIGLPRIREIDAYGDETTYTERALGPYAIIRVKIKNEANKRYVLSELVVNNNTTWN